MWWHCMCAVWRGNDKKCSMIWVKIGLEKQRISELWVVSSKYTYIEAQSEWVKISFLFYLFVWLCGVGSLLTPCIFIVSNICSINFISVEFLVRAQPIQADSRLFRSFASNVKQYMNFTQCYAFCFEISEMYFDWINTWRLTDCLLFRSFNSRIANGKKKDFILRKYFDQMKDKGNWTWKILPLQNPYEHWWHSNEPKNNQ